MILENPHIRLEFSNQGDIISIINPETMRNYMAWGGNGMFRLMLVETDTGDVLPGNLVLTSKMAEKVRVSYEEKKVTFVFENLDDLEITVTTTVRLEEKDAIWSV